MSTLGILSLILGLAVIIVLIFNFLYKPEKKIPLLLLRIGLPVLFLGYAVVTVFWLREVYVNDNLSLATQSAILAMCALATIVAIPFVSKLKRPFLYADMACFLILGVATVISFIYLSKSIYQPNAAIALLPLF